MKIYGLIGFPLIHSFSQKYFNAKFNNENITGVVYKNFQIKKISQLKELITTTPNLCGLNVTIPFKELVIPLLDTIDETAKRVGAVNTIRIDRHGLDHKLTGYNTDIYGFEESIKPLLASYHTKALILGSGGAAKAAVYVMKKMGINHQIVSRKPDPAQQLCYADLTKKIIRDCQIIINTTPLGNFPDFNTFPPIPYEAIDERHLLFDMIYNPPQTQFMLHGEKYGASTSNGLKMLHYQADKAWKIFLG